MTSINYVVNPSIFIRRIINMRKGINNSVVMKYNTVKIDDIELKVFLHNFDKSKLLDSYTVEIKNKHTSIKINLEYLLYKTTEVDYTLINGDIYYSRQDLWNLVICNEDDRILIPRFEIVCDKLKEVVMLHYKVDAKIVELYEYMNALTELGLYRTSYRNDKKACEMFYKYKMKSCSLPLEKILEKDLSYFIQGDVVHHGGKFEGCWYDDEGRKRPRTSPKWTETIYQDTEKIGFLVTVMTPFWAKFNRVTRHLTDDEIYDCFGGKKKALLKFKEIFPRIKDNTINYLRLIALEPNNGMVQNENLEYILNKDCYEKNNYKNLHNYYRNMLTCDLELLINYIIGDTSDPKRAINFIVSG